MSSTCHPCVIHTSSARRPPRDFNPKIFPVKEQRTALLKIQKSYTAEFTYVVVKNLDLTTLSGHCHATISLICISTHKAMAARCLSYHQATYQQPAIRALATAPLRRLALSVLFTIMTNSYQTTCTVSKRTFNKRQHANARHGVDFLLFTHYDMVSAQT